MRIPARRPQVQTAILSDGRDGGETIANEDKPKFWLYPSEALDRYGEWLEANLPAMRAETINWEE